MKIKEKLIYINKNILQKNVIIDILKSDGANHNIDDLVNLWYISVIKKWDCYYNNTIKSVKNPYIIWWAYVNFDNYMFWWLDRYNKEGFSTQISNVFTVYNNKYSKEIEILWIRYKFKKVTDDFLYGKKNININWKKIYYMNKERLFLEFVRENIKYDNEYFIDAYKLLDNNRLERVIKKYPIKQVVLKVKEIQNVCR